MKTVLVTGVSGFVGGHVAVQLLKAGYRVRGSLRSLSRAEQVKQEIAAAGANTDALEFVSLDLLDDAGWTEAVQGVQYVQHVASPFTIDMPEDPDDLIRPAVAGTERAFRAALAADVERIVLVSSMAAISYGHPTTRTEPFSEADWTNLDSAIPVNAYIRSKTLAERRAWEIMREAGREADLAVVNPGFVLGPLLGKDIGTSGQIVRQLLDGSLPAVPRLSFSSVDVRDIAALLIACMEIPVAGGQRFLATSTALSLPEMARLLRKNVPEAAKRAPRITMPDWAARFYALFNKQLRANGHEIGVVQKMNASRAEILLGRPFIHGDEAFMAMAHCMIDRDLIS